MNSQKCFYPIVHHKKPIDTCLHQAIIEENKVDLSAESCAKNPMKIFNENTAEFFTHLRRKFDENIWPNNFVFILNIFHIKGHPS